MNILWNHNEAVDLIEMPLPLITEGTQDMGDGVYWLRAGTPLDEYFAVANDEDAKYVVAEDFYFISTKPEQAKVVPLITSGYVDINKAEKAAGITYSQDCIDALADAGIVLVDGTLPSSGGGGGGGVLVVQKQVNALDFTWQEIHDAMLTGGAVVLFPDVGVYIVTRAFYSSKAGQYVVEANGLNYVTPTADGHPVEDVE